MGASGGARIGPIPASLSRSLLSTAGRNECFLESGYRLDLDGGTDRLLDGCDHLSVILGDEGEGFAFPLGATGSADSMGVGLSGIGDVEIDHMRDPLHIDSSCRDVGGHQDIELPLAESIHRPVTLVLGHVSLQSDGTVPIVIQFLCELPRSSLGPGEDDGGVESVIFQEVSKQFDLALFAYWIEGVLDGVGRDRVIDFHHMRFDQHLFRKFADLLRHRRREQEILSALGKGTDDSPDVGEESHIEHVIRFIEDQGVDTSQVYMALSVQVEQSTGTGADDIGLAIQLLDLRLFGDSSVDRHRLQASTPRQLLEFLIDLADQFPGRSDHQYTRPRFLSQQQVFDAGDREGGGLAGTGLGETENVPSLEGRRDRMGRDRAWGAVAGLGDRRGEGGDQLELVKIGDAGVGGQGDLLQIPPSEGWNRGSPSQQWRVKCLGQRDQIGPVVR